jgi:tetratricopeptide (TPR) repeat protein
MTKTSSSDRSDARPLAGQLVVFTGKLSALGRKDARALVLRLGGEHADEVTASTTMLVVGAEGSRDRSGKLKRAEELTADGQAHIQVISEEAFCQLAGVPTPGMLKRQYHAMRDLLARYRSVREDHLQYLTKYGIIKPVLRTSADTFFAFPDVAAIKQANDEISQGVSFRTVVRTLLASRQGQLAFDFHLDAAPAKIFALQRPHPRVAPVDVNAQARSIAAAEDYFRIASALDDGDDGKQDQAAAAYRKALEIDPHLVAALINLANIHYAHDELAEAQALYERAIGLESDFFEAHFNLGNIYHDLGRYQEAQACYTEALRLNPFYADTHFYLAVTYEKLGLSSEAAPHWKAYQQQAPKGEWVELAKEFSE